MVTEKKITAYKHAKDNIGYGLPYTIESVVNAIRNETYKTPTEELRRLKATGESKKVINDFKQKNFKAVTWSGVYSKRNLESLVVHSGLVCIDFDAKNEKKPDGLTPERFNKLCERLAEDPYVVIAFVSPSGDGLKAIYKTECTTVKDHYVYFESIAKYCLDNYLEVADPSGCDPTRLCFMPYDPYIYTNYDALTFDLVRLPEITDIYSEFGVDTPQHIGAELVAKSRDYENVDDTIRIADLIAQLINKGVDITSDYAEWVKVGAAFASLGEQGRDFFHQVSSINSGYEVGECDKKFNNLLKTGNGSVGISTFFYMCKAVGVETQVRPTAKPDAVLTDDQIKNKEAWVSIYRHIHSINHEGRKWNTTDINFLGAQHGINGDKIEAAFKKIFEKHKDEHGLDSMPDIFKVEAHLKRNFKFIRNEITQRTEYTSLPQTGDFLRMDCDTISRNLQHNHFKFPMDKLKSLLKSDFVPTINPFKEYFFTLQAWDGETDHITALANFVQCEDQEFWVTMFKKALVRSIACAIGGRENRIVMVLVQEKQNTGKSSFIRFLNPFGTKYYTESPLRDNKDTEIRFAENFIYNLEELSSLGAIDINKLKAIISMAFVKERKAYAEDEIEQPRRCSIWGSSNKPEFLTDTENTRWLCHKVKTVNHDYKNKDTGVELIDIHAVWAQAYALYASGKFNYQLTTEEAERRDRGNKEYEQSSDEKDLINMHFAPGTADGSDSHFMNTAEIVLELILHSENKIKFNRIAVGRAMSQLNYIADRQIINNTKVRGFWVRRLKVKPKPQTPNLFNDPLNDIPF